MSGKGYKGFESMKVFLVLNLICPEMFENVYLLPEKRACKLKEVALWNHWEYFPLFRVLSWPFICCFSLFPVFLSRSKQLNKAASVLAKVQSKPVLI